MLGEGSVALSLLLLSTVVGNSQNVSELFCKQVGNSVIGKPESYEHSYSGYLLALTRLM